MKKKVALVLNVLLIIFEIIGFIITYKVGEDITPALYTEDSNLICLIASIMYVIYYFNGKSSNKIVHIFRFMTTLNLLLTFFITLFLLSREYGLYEMMIQNEFIFFHTLCPIVSFISYLFFEKYRATKGDIMYKGAMFTCVYSIVVYTLNILKVIEGPYPFLKVYEQPITQTVVTILGMGVVLAILTFALYEIKKKIKI